ncbi:ricin-type beta-trefoil lectin domain protein [Kitasatospora sp. NPDC096147]|uniref:ricin-type beta-trefoil lectin domain protein n=1 Tax=Kitasatospora sp. NPDC096147 TaxID=3364093 RepID=UPI003805B735
MNRHASGTHRRPPTVFALLLTLALTALALAGVVGARTAEAAETASGPIVGLAGKCLAPTGSNSPAVIKDCDGSTGQSWSVQDDKTLRSGGQCLDVNSGGTTPGLRVWLWSCNGSGAQEWVPGADGRLVNTRSNLCLDVVGGATTSGTPLQIQTCDGSARQAWTLPTGGGPVDPGTPGDVTQGVLTGNGNKCLTATTGPATITGCDRGPAQIWAVPGDRTLRNAGKCLEVTGGGTASGTRVRTGVCNGSGGQVWEPGVSKRLFNPQSGKCLDVVGAGTADGTQVQIYTCNGTYAQEWTLPVGNDPGEPGSGGNGGPLGVDAIADPASTAGVATGFRPTASGGNGQYQWSATGLPAGIAMNYVNGTTMGTPQRTGAFAVVYTVTDANGATASKSFTWTVNAAVTAASHFLDCNAATNGTGTQASPWNSLATANSRTYQPGESLLLKKGSTCTGQLAPKGNGTATAPITLGAYGTGSAKPRVNGNGIANADPDFKVSDATVKLTNQSYWIIENLEVTNDAATEALRSGINAYFTDDRQYAGITIRNNDVHDVKGWSNRDEGGANSLHKFYLSHGIGVDTPSPTGGLVKGVTIADNYVHEVRGVGIGMYGDQRDGLNAKEARNQNVHVVGNTVRNTSHDGIVICAADSPLTEYNTADQLGWNWTQGVYAGIWTWGTTNPTFQYNEVSNIQHMTWDSLAWDCDGYVRGTCTYQYNYDHDNVNGILLTCPGCLGPEATKVVYRYNLSVNDCRLHNATGNMASFAFYGNTIDCRNKNWDFSEVPNFTRFSNNVFLGKAGSSLPNGPSYNGNTYVGFTPPASDPKASTLDPKYVSLPSAPSYGINTLGHYQLLLGSPALGTGATVPGNWGTDLWGNLLNTATPNRGVYGGAGLAPTRTEDTGAAYSGAWSTTGCGGCSGGSARTSTTAGATATFTFTGRTLSLYGIQTGTGGIATVSVDGGAPVEVNTYTPAGTANGQIVWTGPQLAAGTQTVTVTNTGTADPRSTGTAVSLDSWTVSG